MNLKGFLQRSRYAFHMIPVLWSFARDLVWEDLPWDEIRTNYLFGRANAYDRADLLEKSVKVYKDLLKSDPNSIAVLLNLGGLHYRKGILEKAIPYYEKVIRLNPKHYLGHYWLAMCYRKMQRFYAAINTLEEIIEFLPTFKDALNLMGECYERIGEGAKAEHYYLKAISANPDVIIAHGGILDPEVAEKKMEQPIKN
jgi:tetratricopeptide (TPR) repeat protein